MMPRISKQTATFLVTIRQLPADAGKPLDAWEIKADLEELLDEAGYNAFDVDVRDDHDAPGGGEIPV